MCEKNNLNVIFAQDYRNLFIKCVPIQKKKHFFRYIQVKLRV